MKQRLTLRRLAGAGILTALFCTPGGIAFVLGGAWWQVLLLYASVLGVVGLIGLAVYLLDDEPVPRISEAGEEAIRQRFGVAMSDLQERLAADEDEEGGRE